MLFWLCLGLPIFEVWWDVISLASDERSRHTFSMARSLLVWSIHSSPELANLISWWGLHVQIVQQIHRKKPKNALDTLWHLAISGNILCILYCHVIVMCPCPRPAMHHPHPHEIWGLASPREDGTIRQYAQHTAAAQSVSHFVCHQSYQTSSNVIKCHQFIIFYNSLYHLISLSQIVSFFYRSHFGTRPNCKRWSCPAVLRKKQEGQFQWSKWTKPWPNPRPWSQIPALSKRVRHAFKKCPYLERSKDLTNLRHSRQTLKGLVMPCFNSHKL